MPGAQRSLLRPGTALSGRSAAPAVVPFKSLGAAEACSSRAATTAGAAPGPNARLGCPHTQPLHHPQQQHQYHHHQHDFTHQWIGARSRHGHRRRLPCPRALLGDDEGPAFSFDGSDAATSSSSSSSGAASSSAGALAALAARLDSITDTNSLQTALASAIAAEDYPLAARVRDRLRAVSGGLAEGSCIDWASTRLPEWLVDRAERLGWKFPTEVQRRAAPVLCSGSDAVIASETGSGKTLSFLLPCLANLTYPPDMYLDEMKGPQALVVVPTTELGVQVAMLIFKLYGGNVSVGRPGDEANMYTYFGPRGIKVRGILNKEEVVMAKASLAYLSQVHVVVATPQCLMEVVREPQPVAELLRHLKVIAVDEVDECFASSPADMAALLEAAADAAGSGNAQGQKPQVVFVGATQRQEILDMAVEAGWLREPVVVQVGNEGAVPAGLSHRYIVVEPQRRLTALARSLRADLLQADQDAAPARVMLFVNTPAEAAAVADPLRSSLWSDHRMAVLVPPGTILGSTADEEEGGGEAGGMIDELFAYDPIRALQSFRDNKSSLLLVTAAAARGLDLPAVSHVYSLGPPTDATNYLHRAGRAGRIGSTSGGIVTTIVTPDQLPSLLAMGRQLGIQLVQEEEATGELLGVLPRLTPPPDEEEEEEDGGWGEGEREEKGQQGQGRTDVRGSQLLQQEEEGGRSKGEEEEEGEGEGGAEPGAAAGAASAEVVAPLRGRRRGQGRGAAPVASWGRDGEGKGEGGRVKGPGQGGEGEGADLAGLDVDRLRKGLEDLYNLM